MANEEHQAGSNPQATETPGTVNRLRDLTTDALKFWELRRLFYNILLAVIVAGHLVAAWPTSRAFLTLDRVLGLFLLAVAANVAYSAVYLADLFIQLSRFRASRGRWRLVLLLVGFAFAGVLTHLFFTSGMSGDTHQP